MAAKSTTKPFCFFLILFLLYNICSYGQTAGAIKGQVRTADGEVAPSVTLINATVFYDQPKFRVGLKVDNVTDQQYWIGYTTMNPQKPRNFVGSVSFKF